MNKDKKILAINKEGEISADPVKRETGKNQDSLRFLEYSSIGFYLVTPIIAGVFVGLWLDGVFKTKPLFMIICILLGAVGSFYNLFRVTKN